MKAIVSILVLLTSFQSFGASNSSAKTGAENEKMKWLKLGYEVAKAHAPDYEIAEHIVAEKCEEAEVWYPNKDLGESLEYPPSGLDKVHYYESYGLATVYYKCLKKVTKDGTNVEGTRN